MSSKTFFLWPRATLPSAGCFVGTSVSSQSIEEAIQTIYPEVYPVLFSSARAGLSAILEQCGLRRDDCVYAPRFSSHCVLEAISRVATPSPVIGKNKAYLVYNQWGFFHNFKSGENAIIIDDSVDTLFVPGANVLPKGRRYGLWSLPKVLGTLCGGVVFCRSHSDACALKELRSARGVATGQVLLRAISKKSARASSLWTGCESAQGGLPYFALMQIKSSLSGIDKLCRDRLKIISLFSHEMHQGCLNTRRIPSNLPIMCDNAPSELLEYISSGYRHLNTNYDLLQENWGRVLPLPVHKEIDHVTAQTFVKLLEKTQQWAVTKANLAIQ